jgi:TPR repeat protein
VAPDPAKATDLLERAAALNDVGAQVLLAQALLAGGEPGTAARAVDLLETAAAKGEVWPVTVLASLCAKGRRRCSGQRTPRRGTAATLC